MIPMSKVSVDPSDAFQFSIDPKKPVDDIVSDIVQYAANIFFAKASGPDAWAEAMTQLVTAINSAIAAFQEESRKGDYPS
jgi:hypothetical protein